ncbi:NAD-dependent epimerase/dehydratase family protein [Pseudomonas sp. TE50-2]|uniref:NAD-dependent epimerase/dehydratase family protein n=1 Tax=Pseudomonas sp. TE50-2 TaxID=3142707 RepID=UPI003464EF03
MKSQEKKILVTGSSGFIGSALIARLADKEEVRTIAALRETCANNSSLADETVIFTAASQSKNFIPFGVSTVIHLAGRAHILNSPENSTLDIFRKDNVELTLNLAKQALQAGVRHFIFISSIGVNGTTTLDKAFDESSTPAPCTPYAHSKWEAEQALHALLRGSSMALTIIRPPLTYAGHAPGNFRRLQKLVASRLPLPLAMIRNTRSMIALDNLVDFILLCSEHPAAANETFVIADGQDFSTPQIIKHLAQGQGKHGFMIPFPVGMMNWAARYVGMEAAFQQLCGSLQINPSKASSLLGWQPPYEAEAALIKAGYDFANNQQH